MLSCHNAVLKRDKKFKIIFLNKLTSESNVSEIRYKTAGSSNADEVVAYAEL